jgi:hypothetical protein
MFRTIAIGAALAAALTGCSSVQPAESPTDSGLVEIRYPLSDGRTVTCLWKDSFKKSVLSCDWDGASE